MRPDGNNCIVHFSLSALVGLCYNFSNGCRGGRVWLYARGLLSAIWFNRHFRLGSLCSSYQLNRCFLAQFPLGIRPQNPTPVKLEPYECGVQTIGGTWNQFNFRYYLFAILFVIFDVEVVFLYPWATKFIRLELFALLEMAVFVGILLVGWAYAWRKRDLEWGN